MKINDLRNKEKWYRCVRSDEFFNNIQYQTHPSKAIPIQNGIVRVPMTQEDFRNEVNPFTHNINSALARSNRKVYKQVTDPKTGVKKKVFSHYDEVYRVALGLQDFIISTKVAHASFAGIWTSNETPEYRKEFEEMQTMYDVAGMKYAWIKYVKSLLYTCDAAIYLYKEGNEVKWEVFSNLDGDVLYPNIDEKGNPVFVREFMYQGKTAVQIFTLESVETWIQDSEDEKKEISWRNRWLNFLSRDGKTFSEDGWTRISRTPNQLKGELPVIYSRIKDLPTAEVQLAITNIEDILSDFGEEAKMYAYQAMFFKGKVTSIPSPQTRGKTYVALSQDSDAKILSPANSSDVVKILVDKLESEVFRTSKTVYITPEMIKGSDVATASLKLLFTPQVQWCESFFADMFKDVKEMMDKFKTLTGQVYGKPSRYYEMKFSVGLDVWIPENEKELVEVTTQKVYAGLMSKSAGRVEVGNKYAGEEEAIKAENEEKMKLSLLGKGQTTDDNDNPYKPKVDNKDTIRTT